MLSISEFSFMCQLSPQALRFYHAEGLLVPAAVDEQTGYRWYELPQVERAMLISVLRSTGMSVKLVRRAVEEPDAARDLLAQHVTELQRRRQTQDAAISDAHAFLTSWPEVRRVHAPATTVVSAAVPGLASGSDRYRWAAVDAACTAAAADLVRTVTSCGAVVSGTPWRSWAMGMPELIAGSESPGGPQLRVTVPVRAAEGSLAELPDDVEVRTFEAHDELSILVPGRTSMAKFGTALSRLLAHPLEDAVLDISRMRQVPHPDGMETTVAIAEAAHDDREHEFPNLTNRAHTVLDLAIGQARAEFSPHVGTGHLLGGIFAEGANLALAMLRAVEIDPARVRRDLAQRTEPEPGGSQEAASPSLSTAAARALALATSEAAAQGSTYVGCEHLLLGLLGETTGSAGHVLRALGAEIGSARRVLAAALAGVATRTAGRAAVSDLAGPDQPGHGPARQSRSPP
ncbi:Clp protease N-terminal domain-containing protein [Jidongwangia harbinensis]|uniref:Clp protease N-terminal domain-containing protein n=1 Tax=Jidongwangia harbinensis TaxID=2878561 RepID=UPI001CDA1E4B|nr:Clp protease N-terminal domain-containing protein [Jidongwangia harbinensis]MCA2215492.1 MerR family transcriptional regulator [Jidongwangia harbinensis]